MKLHGENGFQVKCQIIKNKEIPIIELGDIFPTVMIVCQTELRFGCNW